MEDSYLDIQKLGQDIKENNNVMEQIAYDDEHLAGVSHQDPDEESIQVNQQQDYNSSYYEEGGQSRRYFAEPRKTPAQEMVINGDTDMTLRPVNATISS